MSYFRQSFIPPVFQLIVLQIFQTQYYGKACGVDPDLRDAFRPHIIMIYIRLKCCIMVSTPLALRQASSIKILFYRSSPYFSACEQFCRDWDMTSFDPQYPNMQLEE